MEEFSRWVGGVKPPGARERGALTGGWKLAGVAVVVGIVVLIAGLMLHSGNGFLGSRSGPNMGIANRTDLCTSNLGPGCEGYQITLPYGSGALEENVSSCVSIYPTGSSAHLLLNYTSSTYMYGVLIPTGFYTGASTSFHSDPSGFLNDPPVVAEAAWDSGYSVGDRTVNVSIPSSFPGWCLAWWDPGQLGTVTFAADAYLWY